jgi:hypothetical protein
VALYDCIRFLGSRLPGNNKVMHVKWPDKVLREEFAIMEVGRFHNMLVAQLKLPRNFATPLRKCLAADYASQSCPVQHASYASFQQEARKWCLVQLHDDLNKSGLHAKFERFDQSSQELVSIDETNYDNNFLVLQNVDSLYRAADRANRYSTTISRLEFLKRWAQRRLPRMETLQRMQLTRRLKSIVTQCQSRVRISYGPDFESYTPGSRNFVALHQIVKLQYDRPLQAESSSDSNRHHDDNDDAAHDDIDGQVSGLRQALEDCIQLPSASNIDAIKDDLKRQVSDNSARVTKSKVTHITLKRFQIAASYEWAVSICADISSSPVFPPAQGAPRITWSEDTLVLKISGYKNPGRIVKNHLTEAVDQPTIDDVKKLEIIKVHLLTTPNCTFRNAVKVATSCDLHLLDPI